MAQTTEKISIDILVNIIDNFGDMGFALELLIALEARTKGKYNFRIFTNNTSLLELFFLRNTHLLWNYQILEDTSFLQKNPAEIIFSLFHREIPIFDDTKKRLILRFDYLSLDTDWVAMNGAEHIASSETTKIIELIPSPLQKSAWLIQHKMEKYDKKSWLEKQNLPIEIAEKKWILIFAYEPTIERMDLDSLDDDIIVLFVWTKNVRKEISQKCIFLDVLSFDDYYSLLSLSDLTIVRGEVSFVQALEAGKPFFWDLYKEKWGFPEEMSEQFLKLWDFSKEYKELHRELNTGKWSISLMTLWTFQSEKLPFMMLGESARKRDIIDTIEKYIDSFDFFL